jgi:hypothetical protein
LRSTETTSVILTSIVGVANQCAAQIESYIAWCEDSGGHLVEQRLELLIVVLVEQGDPNIRFAANLRTVQPGETTAYDHDVLTWCGFCSADLVTVVGSSQLPIKCKLIALQGVFIGAGHAPRAHIYLSRKSRPTKNRLR